MHGVLSNGIVEGLRGFAATLTRAGATIGILTVLIASPAMARPIEAKLFMAEEIRCLALNIYFEARGEPDSGKRAVGYVVLNRVADPRFPGGVCQVVQQGGERRRYRCQFSWWCDGRSDRPTNRQAWEKSLTIARYLYWGFAEDPTYGALWYHALEVRPTWRKDMMRGPRIGRHVFYLPKPKETRVQQAAAD